MAFEVLIVGFMAAGSPLLLYWLTARARKFERAEDFARLDAVAAEARKASSKTTSKLDQIHILVNSNLTAAQQGELNQTRLVLTVLRRIENPTEEEHREITATQARIRDLEKNLEERSLQLKQVEAEQKAQALREK